MAAAKAVWRSSCGGGDRREPAWILGFRRKRTNLHEKYGYPTIRFYEREGLLPTAARTEGNYRIYTPHHAERLAFIRQCRSLDMTLDEVRVLLRFKDQPAADCGEVNSLLDEHIGHVAERIQALRALEKELRALRAACPVPHAAADCGILQGIDHAGAKPPTAARRHVRGAH